MKYAAKILSVVGLVATAGFSAGALAAPACPGLLTLPTATGANSVTFGDGISYALPILGLDVQSSPGQIQDCIVIATGASGAPVNTNFAGMDNAYATPNGTGGSPYLRTGDATSSPDPGQVAAFNGDTDHTWDTTIAALETFLNGADPVIYFNHNQTNSGSAIDQNLAIWAQIRLWNFDTGASQYFYITSVPNLTGLQNFGAPGGDPTAYTGPQTAATNTYPSGSDAAGFPTGGVGTGTGSGDASFMVNALGQVCLNGPVGSGTPVACSDPSAVTTVNLNLGADHVANAVVFPEINALLNSPNNGGFTNISIDLRMGCNAAQISGGQCPNGFVLNNGYEQLFIGRLSPEEGPPTIPEPGTVALVALGLLLTYGAMKRRTI